MTSFLPSGVHLKALETYHIVFTCLGTARLAHDLPLYAAGLFPLLSHCSTSIKAPLLSLYENHFLPLGLALSPILDGLVLAILPGLEDESSEFYSRSRTLLDNIANVVSDVGIFGRALWRALLLSAPMRLAASDYLRSKLAAGQDDLRAEMVSDMPLVAYALAAALSDNNALAQRAVLDLLLGELVLNSPFFHCETPDKRDAAVAVVGGVFGALLRRDISLTKRVHAWFLGGLDSETGISFCNQHSSQLVLAAIDTEIEHLLKIPPDDPKSAIRPCKIAAALMDREELAVCFGPHFALRVLRYGMLAIAQPNNLHEREIRSSIADLLHNIGSARVFAELERMLANEEKRTHEDFELLTFALSMFPTKNEVVQKKHLPELLRVAVQSLNDVSADILSLDKAVAFCSRAVLSMGLSRRNDVDEAITSNIEETVAAFASFFVAWLAHAVELAPAELRREYADVSVSEECAAEFRMAAICEPRKECINLAKGACSFFVTVSASGISKSDIIRSSLQATAKCASAADVRISLAGARGFAEAAAFAKHDMFSVTGSDEQVLGVIRRCWRQMHPSLRTATPQSAQTLLLLQRRFPEETKVVIADGILSTDLSRRLRNLERFACLWRLSVEHRLLPLPADDGLFLMLDALTDDDWGPKMLARSWLSDALEVDTASVLDAPLRLLWTSESRSVGPAHTFASVYDAPRALYGFQSLRGILESCPTVMGASGEQGYILPSPRQLSRKDGKRERAGVRALASSAPSPRAAQALASVFALGDSENSGAEGSSSNGSMEEGPVLLGNLLPAHDYVVTVALTCLGYLRGRVPDRFISSKKRSQNGVSLGHDVEQAIARSSNESADDDLEWVLAGLGSKPLTELHAGVCAAAAECLATLLTAIPVPSQMSAVISNMFAEPILTLIQGRVGDSDPVLELHFLNVMTFLVTADGPYYLSSIQGKETFTKSDTGRIRFSFSESQIQAPTIKPSGENPVGRHEGGIESLKSFTPWLLEGVTSTYRSLHREHDSGSQEVLGIRRRWIHFMDTVVRHIGVSVPIVTEGLLVVLCELLALQRRKVAEEAYSGDSEFSRVDETLVLLEGLAVVTSNVLWSFEHALAHGDLKDNSHSKISLSIGEGSSSKAQLSALGKDGYNVSTANGNSNQVGELEKSHIHVGVSSADSERIDHVSNATTAVINAINPLRMIDFVKDVLTGSGSDGMHKLFDPRRSGARILFCLLPNIVGICARVWGPSTEAHIVENMSSIERLSRDDANPPRLSMELPRERRQAQRNSVLSVLEPIFELRRIDVISSVITLYCDEQSEYGEMQEKHVLDVPSRMSSYILHALDYATPDVVVSAVKRIFEKAVVWDQGWVEAEEGRNQIGNRIKARAVLEKLVSNGIRSITDEEMSNIGRIALGDDSSSLAGGNVGLDLSVPTFATFNGMASGHQEAFHWGDLFAQYSPGAVETACLNFLDHFIATCNDGDDVQGAWPTLYVFLKDALVSTRRKASVPAILRVLGSFVAKNPSPFPERRYRKEIMVTSVSAISSCGSLASGNTDVSLHERNNISDFKKQMSIVALRALATTVPMLVDSTFLEDKPQLSNSVSTCLGPAVLVLKKAAGRAAALQLAADNLRRHSGSEGQISSKRANEIHLDCKASKAATEVLLHISSRDWGVKHARRDLVSLIEDTNFFYGKDNGVLQQMSAIVREVMASGGAGFLLSSIGGSSSNGAPGIPGLFSGRDSENLVRARTIRRIAFCVFVSEPDCYSPQLPSILERIRDALRIGNAGLIVECLLCLRALLVRVGASSISAFRASTLSEMFRIGYNPTDDLNATIAALKFLDLITLLSPPDFGFERCFFFQGGGPEDVGSSEVKAFRPLARSLGDLWEGDKKDLESVFSEPFRLEQGCTVLPGRGPREVTAEFIGRYATALAVRNSMPKMKTASVDKDVLYRELEMEFLM